MSERETSRGKEAHVPSGRATGREGGDKEM